MYFLGGPEFWAGGHFFGSLGGIPGPAVSGLSASGGILNNKERGALSGLKNANAKRRVF